MSKYSIIVVNSENILRLVEVEAEDKKAAIAAVELNENEHVYSVKVIREKSEREKSACDVVVVYMTRNEVGSFELVRNQYHVFGTAGNGKNAIRDIKLRIKDMGIELPRGYEIESINGYVPNTEQQ